MHKCMMKMIWLTNSQYNIHNNVHNKQHNTQNVYKIFTLQFTLIILSQNSYYNDNELTLYMCLKYTLLRYMYDKYILYVVFKM